MRAESGRAGGPREIIRCVRTYRSSEIEAATRRRSLIGSAFIAEETAEPPASAGALAMAAWSPCACERMRRSWARRGGGMPASYSAKPAIRQRDLPLRRPRWRRDDAEMAPKSHTWRSGRRPRPKDAEDRQEIEIEQAGEAVRHL